MNLRLPTVTTQAATAPRVLHTLTNAELANVAESVFPNPSPIIALLIARLIGGRTADPDYIQPEPHEHTLHCPQCGTQLQIEVKDTDV